MARIPEHDIQRLKDEISVLRLVESAGVELKKNGKDWAGRCPFHADDTASLVITPSKNLWHCFGCQTGGGVVDWVMKLKGVSFRHAVELLKDESALAAGASESGAECEPVKHSTVRSLPAPVALDADDRALLLQVVDYYALSLKQSPEALAYLQSRGLHHPELIDYFKLGFANRTLGLRLPHKNRKAGADIRARLERLGVYRASGHEHFNGSLVVPVLDAHGQVCELYGRKVTASLPLSLQLRQTRTKALHDGGLSFMHRLTAAACPHCDQIHTSTPDRLHPPKRPPNGIFSAFDFVNYFKQWPQLAVAAARGADVVQKARGILQVLGLAVA